MLLAVALPVACGGDDPGTVDVTVTTSAGTSPTNGVIRNGFTWVEDADAVTPMKRTLGRVR